MISTDCECYSRKPLDGPVLSVGYMAIKKEEI